MQVFSDNIEESARKLIYQRAERSILPVSMIALPHSSDFEKGHSDAVSDIPDLGAYILDENYLAGPHGLVLGADGLLQYGRDLIVSQYFNDTICAAASRNDDTDPLNRFITGRAQVTDHDGDLIHVTKAGWQVYGHWLLDILPCIWMARKLQTKGEISSNARFLLPKGTPAWALKMAQAAVGLSEDEIVFFDEAQEVVRAKTLIVPSLLRIENGFSPLFNDMVAEYIDKFADGETRFPSRLFVYREARPSFDVRSFPQQDELAAIAKERGFAILDPSTLSWKDQVQLFSQVDSVLGPFGSGMHNTVFSKPGTKNIVLANSRMNWIQSGISALRSQHLGYIQSERESDFPEREIYYDLNTCSAIIDTVFGHGESVHMSEYDVTNAAQITNEREHKGVHYHRFMSDLSRLRGTERYLEIGVQNGNHLSGVHTERAVGVDPFFSITANIAANKKEVTLVQDTSDRFFNRPDLLSVLGGAPDLAFLDGMHVFEFLLRDFYNTEAVCRKGSLIAIHDCLPLVSGMMKRGITEAFAETAGTPHEGQWTGDVWKIIPILQKYRPDLKIVCVDCPPTGLLFITGLDPESTVLRENYLKIVEEYRTVPNDTTALENLYASIEVVDSNLILNEFDHSLYFNVN